MEEKKQPSADHNLIQGGKSSGLNKVIIHTMPKRYLGGAKPAKDNHKSTGLLILMLGVVILIGAFAAAYYFLIKKPLPMTPVVETTQIEESAKPIEKIPVAKEEPEPEVEEVEEEIPIVVNDEPEIIEEATGTEVSRIEIDINPVDQVPTQTLKAAADTDKDALSDTEEILLDTNPASKDSDGDTYEDGAELAQLFNPAGGGTIIANPNIKKYTNSSSNYTLYYPAPWTPNVVSGSDSLMFSIGAGQFIQIVVLEKETESTLVDWYKKQFDVAFIGNGQTVFKEGWEGVKTEDNLTYYLLKPGTDRIVTMSYNPGSSGVLNYQKIFEMMINSLTSN